MARLASLLAVLAVACDGHVGAISPDVDAGGGADALAPDATPPDATPPDEIGLTPEELLGKRIFEDPDLSEPAGVACASCHVAGQAFTGNAGSPVAAVSRGAPAGALGFRNAQTAMYASLAPAFHFEQQPDGAWRAIGGLFWDGRANNLVAQAEGPLVNPREMANPTPAAVVAKVRAASYAPLFVQVFGTFDDGQPYQHIVHAIAAFESTPRFHPFASRFDAYLRGEGTLDAHELHGLALFIDAKKGNCITCHAGNPSSLDPHDWPFTNYTFVSLGVPRNPAIPDDADPSYFDLGLCSQPGLAGRTPTDVAVSSLCGAFQVPTLRNVAVTAPYFHNGRFTDLHDVVRFYATRDTDPAHWYPTDGAGHVQMFDDLPAPYHANVTTGSPYDGAPGQPAHLTDAEIDDIVAFLETLTDASIAP